MILRILSAAMLLLACSAAHAQFPTTGLRAYWKLDEASGNAVDSFGANTLTETSGTIASAAGKISTARDFGGATDTEHFLATDNADLSMGDIDFTVGMWVKFDALTNFTAPLAKDNKTTQREYGFYYNAAAVNRMKFYVTAPGGAVTEVSANDFGALSTGTWYYIVGWHDAANNVLGISVNDTATTASYSAGVRDGTAGFSIGADSINGQHLDGQVDEVGVWKGLPDRSVLYSSGNGLTYSASNVPLIIQQLFSRVDQRQHFDAYGVYALAL